jgi:hypothetical protein
MRLPVHVEQVDVTVSDACDIILLVLVLHGVRDDQRAVDFCHVEWSEAARKLRVSAGGVESNLSEHYGLACDAR